MNVLKIGAQGVEVIPYWFERDASEFVAREPTTVARSK